MPTDSRFDEAKAPAFLKAPESVEVGLLDLLLILVRRKRFMCSSTLAGAIAGAIVAWSLPATYTATAVILVPQQQQSTAAALIGQMSPLAAMAGRDLGLKNPSDLYVGLLNSRTIEDNIVKEFRLQDIYAAKTLTDARKKLGAHTNVETGKDSLIRIAVEEKDAVLAANIANAYVDQLHKQNSMLAITEASQRRLFFEQQLQSEKNALADAEEVFKTSQQTTGVLQVSGQAEMAIGALAKLRGEIMEREVALQRLSAGATPQNPEVVRQRAEIEELRRQLAALEARETNRRPGNPLISAANIPGAGLEYLRRLREVKYHETLFELLAKQYETARIDESREAPVIQVVDAAAAPEKKSGPPRALIVHLGIAASFLTASAIVVTQAMLTDPGDAAKLASIARAFKT